MAEIFLSYRRQDSQSATGRLADRLEEHFGAERVFRDHEAIVAGEDFAEAIRRAIEASTVVLVVIGPRWLEARAASGARRLDDPADFVRLEIERALDADVAVVPVLVEGAAIPATAALPPSLAAFARCEALELSESRWRYDADRLIEALEQRFAIESVQPPLAADAAAAPGETTRLVTDLLDLATRPKQLIARRQTGRTSDHRRALAFALGAIAAGNLALLVGLDVRPSPSALAGSGPFAVLSWLAAGELVGVLVAALLTAALALAWRLAGATAALRRVSVISAYVYGGAWLGFCAGALLLGAAVQWVEPGLFDRVMAAARDHVGADFAGTLGTLNAVPFRGAMVGLVLLAGVIWLATLVWCVAAWGAYRQAFGVGRGRAALATVVWLALVGALFALTGWLG
jgi:hypothetical protein